MKSQNTKSSDELKNEVHHELRHVRRDLDDITGMLSPGALLDRAVFQRHNRSLRASMDHLMNNPIGTAFLSMGTILLMEDEFNETYETKMHNRFIDMKGRAKLQGGAASEKIDELKGRISDLKQDIQSRSQELKDRVQDRMSDMKGSVQSKAQAVQSKISNTTENISQESSSVKGGVRAKVSDFADKIEGVESNIENKIEGISQNVQDKARDLKENLKSKVQAVSDSDFENWRSSAEEPRIQKVKDALGSVRDKVSSGIESGRETISNMDPVTYMALGAGLGVLTGASLPVSDKERSFVNEQFSERISSFDQDVRDAINECSNILKDLVISDVKDFSFKVL